MKRPATARRRRPAQRPEGGPDRPDPRLLRGIQQLALAGLALLLVWPAARGSNAWLGWLPLWLLGMPAAAWWALLRFPLPRWPRRRRPANRRSAQARSARLPRPRAASQRLA